MRSMNSFSLATSAFVAFLVAACGGAEPPPPPPPPAVEYQAAELQPIATTFEFVARTRAKEDTEIRARISGTIVERNFEEGQQVVEGTLLFKIDPRPYVAALNAARAELAQAKAAVDVAERNYQRGQELLPDGFISRAEFDQLTGERDRAVAAIQGAEAAIERAEVDLDFTEIRAPFSGRAGRSQLSIGDLVGPSAGTLVTLVQQDPMLVDFDVDEQSLGERIKENQERLDQGLEPIVFTPRLRLVTGDFYSEVGEINYANNRVDLSTGTITVTAGFPNPDNSLIPGQFARIVIQRGEPEMRLLVPQPSVLEDMQGSYVYIINDDDTVARRNVSLGQRDGVNRVVESGLNEGDRVIVNGIQKVRPNMPVAGTPVGAQPHSGSGTAN